jgi:rRNA maturation RNase YbeY
MRALLFFDRQKTRTIRRPLLRQVAKYLLEEARGHSQYELGVHCINAVEMARLNETFLGHHGSTDVITFDERENGGWLRGEIFISIDDAVAQAATYRTKWQEEFARYLAHGILHLEGFDDRSPKDRSKMKREENKLVKELSQRHDLGRLG